MIPGFFDALPYIVWLCLKLCLMDMIVWRASVHTF
jgi:hypothetical protein